MNYFFGFCFSNSSKSMRSFVRPVDALLRSNSSRPMKFTSIPSRWPRTRVGHASSNSTPEIAEIKSMRLGSCPSWITLPGVSKSLMVISKLANPNCRMDCSTRSALIRFERRKKSISAEYRGNPCQETARAPTIMYSTLFYSIRFAFKHSTNSRKSFVSGIRTRPFFDCEEYVDALLWSHLASGQSIRRIGLFKAVEYANGLVHTLYFTARQPVRFVTRQHDDITVVTVRRNQ